MCIQHLSGLEENRAEEDDIDDFIREGLEVVRQQIRENDDENENLVGFLIRNN